VGQLLDLVAAAGCVPSEIRADHTVDGLTIEFRPRPVWEPYVEAVLARQRQEQNTLVPVTTSERKTGLEPAVGPSHASRPRRRARPAAQSRMIPITCGWGMGHRAD
jgi:hypothetical protein